MVAKSTLPETAEASSTCSDALNHATLNVMRFFNDFFTDELEAVP